MKLYKQEFDIPKNWFDTFLYLTKDKPNCMIIRAGENERYSYVGLNPKEFLYTENNQLLIVTKSQVSHKVGDILKHVTNWIQKNKIEIEGENPPFITGAFGYFSFEILKYYFDFKYIDHKKENLPLPEIGMMIFHEIFVIDHDKSKMYIYIIDRQNNESIVEQRFNDYVKLLIEAKDIRNSELVKSKRRIYDNKEMYKKIIEDMKKEINLKNIYNMVTPYKMVLRIDKDPLDIMCELNKHSKENIIFMKTTDFSIILSTGFETYKVYKDRIIVNYEYIKASNNVTDNNKYKIHVKNSFYEQISTIAEFTGLDKQNEKLIIKGKLNERVLDNELRTLIPLQMYSGLPLYNSLELIDKYEPYKRNLFGSVIGWIDSRGNYNFFDSSPSLLIKENIIELNIDIPVFEKTNDSNIIGLFNERAKNMIRRYRLTESDRGYDSNY